LARQHPTTSRSRGGHPLRSGSSCITRGVIVSPRVGSTRFSAHFYNSSDDVGHALATLDKVLR
jgi:selenocysteine lyase/cysteine desulfurase